MAAPRRLLPATDLHPKPSGSTIQPPLQPWADRLAICAEEDPSVALYFLQSSVMPANINENDIVLEIGKPSPMKPGGHIFQIGTEQVVVIVNKSNPLSRVPTEQLSQIFIGNLSAWDHKSTNSIHVWVLPDGEPVQQLFSEALGLNQTTDSEAMLAPDPKIMLEAVSKDKNAIGYLPELFLNSDVSPASKEVKTLQLDPSLTQALRQPILAITQDEPTTIGRNLLVCLQGTIH